MRLNKRLYTDFEKDIEGGVMPWAEYPRPRLRRDSYMCLNGKWYFEVARGENTAFSGEILVPFVPESRISGVERETAADETLIYRRSVTLPEGFMCGRVLLHIGACDQYAQVLVNGRPVADHVGGYLPICVDITDFLDGHDSFELCIKARDPLDIELPYGKQTRRRGGMWYTNISGIWQTVWLESVPQDYIEDIKVTTDLCGADIYVRGGDAQKTLCFEGKEYAFEGEHFRLDISEPRLWTPDCPHLYEFEVRSGEDSVRSYFGLRTVSVEKRGERTVICLNGQPLFCHGLLDQGYFSDGIFLPASPRGFENDILQMKRCGFNMLRKHIKLEPELFYYYCDKLGMLVFQDFINNGKYSFLIDTALPTAGLKKGVSHRATARRRAAFEDTAEGIVEQLYSHPSVVYYTIFNEGWGQFDADAYYRRFKALDPTRVWDTASGWFRPRCSDVDSEHVYFKPVRLRASGEGALVLSEFGGYSCKIAEHSYNLDKTYGYRFFSKTSEFEAALYKLYRDEIIPAIRGGLCAAVLTQVSDVEDETNGLLTYDRRLLKVDTEAMAELSSELYQRFDELYK